MARGKYKEFGKNVYYKGLSEASKGMQYGGAFLLGSAFVADALKNRVDNLGFLEKMVGGLIQHWLPVGEQFAMAASQLHESTIQDSYVIGAGLFAIGLASSLYSRKKLKK